MKKDTTFLNSAIALEEMRLAAEEKYKREEEEAVYKIGQYARKERLNLEVEESFQQCSKALGSLVDRFTEKKEVKNKFVVVNSNEELKNAVGKRESILVKDKDLCRKIILLSQLQESKGVVKEILKLGASLLTTSKLSILSGLPIAVSITLIVTIGTVAIVAIIKDYTIIRKDNGDIIMYPSSN